MDFVGIAAGVVTAILSACAFLSSTWALKRTPGLTPSGLMTDAGLLMGVIAIGLLGWHWNAELFTNGFWRRLPVLAGSSAFFCLGQTLVFAAQRKVEASRVVPLLGLKLPILALISVCFLNEHLGIWQGIAIALAVLAAFVLNNAGKAIPFSAIGFVLGGCLSYSFSDICLTRLTARLGRDLGESQAVAALHCTGLSYLLIGIVAALLLCIYSKPLTRAAMLHCIPFSVFWIACIVALTFCFARVGTVFGIILQNTRGIFAILLTPLCIWLGCTALESKLTYGLFWRRFAAALMVLAAVALYSLR